MDLEDLPLRLKKAGRTQAELARYLGLDPSSLTKTIKGERRLKADELVKIGEFFGEEAEMSFHSVEEFRRRSPARRIPVFGYIAPGQPDRIIFSVARAIDFVDPPEFWNGAGELVGVRVPGAEMAPRLFPGETVFAQLGLPPVEGKDCVLEFSDGTAVVRTFLRLKDGHAFVRKWDDDKEIPLPATGLALHAVVWRR